jgi:hypothetical protein
MNNLTSLQRKLVYGGGILLLLIPIIWLGAPPEPATVNPTGAGRSEGSSGGRLAQKRVEFGLGEADLGNVDPASSTMNLLLLGFRGIATSMLWMDAQKQQRDKDWAGLRSTTESIILLQPHFLKVWHFQGWNLAYNVSAEWDGVADRYYWVKEGIKFFKKGRDRNAKYAELYWYVGDTTGKKIGRSDEAKQFRGYFRKDPDEVRFNGGPDPEVNPHSVDNYVEAGTQFQRANDTIETYQNEQHIMAPYLFRSYPYRAMFDHAMALQREGNFGEVCQNIWAESFIAWTTKYGRMEFHVDFPGLEMKIHLEVPAEELQKMIADEDAKAIEQSQRESNWVGRYQDTCNYRYWRTRSRLESEKEMADAHRELYEAEQALDRADTTAARRLYLEGMTKFEKKLNEYAEMKDQDETIEEALLAVFGWQKAIELDEDEVPDEFPLKELWDVQAARRMTVKQEFDRRRRAPR